MQIAIGNKKYDIQGRYNTHLFEAVDALAAQYSVVWWRMNLILTKALQKTLHFKSRSDDSGYIYFNYKEARNLGGIRYKEVFATLEDAGLLANKGYMNFKNSTQSIYAYEYLEILPYKYDSPVYNDKVSYSLTVYAAHKIRGLSTIARDKLIPMLRHIKIKISESEYWTAVDHNYPEYQIKCNRKHRIALPIVQYRKNYLHLWSEIQGFNTASGSEIYQFINEDSFSGRVHTIITTLPKFIKELGVLEYKGERMEELDIKSFRPVLLSLILKDMDFSRWFFSVDDCYTEIRILFNLPSRAAAKEYVFGWMFGTPYGKHHKEFCEIFPEAGLILTQIKQKFNPDNPNSFKVGKSGKKAKNYHSNAAFLLQKKEVETMKQVWAMLAKNQIPFCTIHDAVMVAQSRAEEANRIMQDTLNKHLKLAKGNIEIRRTDFLRSRQAA